MHIKKKVGFFSPLPDFESVSHQGKEPALPVPGYSDLTLTALKLGRSVGQGT